MRHFKIEKDIKIPPKHIPHTVFPLNNMGIGDSFFVHIKDFKVDSVNALRMRVYTRIKKFQEEADIDSTIFRVASLRQEKGVRVFRVK